MSKVVHFELPADDPKRAVAFYEKVFGWSFTKWEGMDYWLVTAGPDDEPGINGAITPPLATAEQGTICSMSSASVDESARKVVNAGGNVIMPKGPVPSVGYLVMCKDTEGNVFSIIEFDPTAK
jgi:predicted enzyme related to lactoylglutathione lyase